MGFVKCECGGWVNLEHVMCVGFVKSEEGRWSAVLVMGEKNFTWYSDNDEDSVKQFVNRQIGK